ncbi:MAG: hypothetical protein GEU79_05085 [Acidimicrobiia bacterium]|nr:hypothetical protein [Acidimicrobiia bacterium]
MSCQAAGPLGAHAADTVLNRIGGEPAAPVSIGFLGQCISLGRGGGIFQFSRRDDTAISFYLGSGKLGAKIKEFVCWGTVKQLMYEANKPGWFSMPAWATDRKRQQLLQAKRDAPDLHRTEIAYSSPGGTS